MVSGKNMYICIKLSKHISQGLEGENLLFDFRAELPVDRGLTALPKNSKQNPKKQTSRRHSHL